MYKAIGANKRNTFLIMAVFVGLISAIGYIISSFYGNTSITYWVIGGAALYALIQYFAAGKLAVAMTGAQEIEKRDNPRLYRVVENLSITLGMPMPKVYLIDDSAPNAFATGRDPEHAVVCVTTGLMEKLDKTELEGVIAHELSHVANYDIRMMSLIAVLVSIIALLSDFFLRWGFFMGGGRRRDGDSGGGQSQVIFMLIAIVLAIVAPIIGVLIQLAVSRKREYLADASGALLTRYPEGLANALRKISGDTEPLEAANKATANMYIINPLRANVKDKRGKGFGSKLFSTHPPTADRIAKLESMDTHA